MKTDIDNLLNKHENLVHSDNQKVVSHVQREKDDWVLNTVMIEGCDVPFKYNRKKLYKNLKGARVNLTFYPATESVAGFDMEIMKTVRIKQA